ncbi:MAG TPA: hypothetical protein VHO94_01500 [Oscillospiraceae bacterium]|nr:hypothetical protein [Oscillospiraceae bacterium]
MDKKSMCTSDYTSEEKKDAYLFLLHKALVEIRYNSSIYNRLESFDPDEINKYIQRINGLADAFHNLPIFLQSNSLTNEKFNEEVFLDYISKSQPEYKELFDDTLKNKIQL